MVIVADLDSETTRWDTMWLALALSLMLAWQVRGQHGASALLLARGGIQRRRHPGQPLAGGRHRRRQRRRLPGASPFCTRGPFIASAHILLANYPCRNNGLEISPLSDTSSLFLSGRSYNATLIAHSCAIQAPLQLP